MESAKSVALIKKNSEVPSYAVMFLAELINSTSLWNILPIVKYLSHFTSWFSHYLLHIDLIPCSFSTKPIPISTNNLRIFIILFAITAFEESQTQFMNIYLLVSYLAFQFVKSWNIVMLLLGTLTNTTSLFSQILWKSSVRTDRALNPYDSSTGNIKMILLHLPQNIGPSSNSLLFRTDGRFTK